MLAAMPLPPLETPHDWRLRAEALVIGVPANVFLFGALGLMNAGQVLSLAALPFSRATFRKANRFIADRWQRLAMGLCERLYGFELVVTGDDPPPRENALVIANHQQMPDIPILWDFAARKQRCGDTRFFVKDALKHVPGIGWGLRLHGQVLVKRNWAADEAAIARTFARFAEEELPLWLVLFAEGTRVTADKIARAQARAPARGLPVLRHVLPPRGKGFLASLGGLGARLDAIYDVTIGYEHGVPDMLQFLAGYVRRAHLHVRRFPLAALPPDDDGRGRWLIERWAEKDALLDRYYREGRFPEGAAAAPAAVTR
jgi:1-acyl-sn-glycerol-3-phosphate acyltransferase